MDYLKLFDTTTEQNEHKSSIDYNEPHVSCLVDGSSVKYNSDGELTFVDLGLPSGTLGATCNLGTHSLSGYGDFYKGGELEPYDASKDYKYGQSQSASGMTKYNDTDGKTQLELGDDAAFNAFGTMSQGKVVIPIDEEGTELKNNCSGTRTNDVGKGTRNGKNIYLSLPGYIGNIGAKSGQYGSANLTESNKARGNCFYITNSAGSSFLSEISNLYRISGCVIRPVIAPFRGYTKIYDETGNFSGTQVTSVNGTTGHNWLYPYVGKDAIVVIDGVSHNSSITTGQNGDPYGEEYAQTYGLQTYLYYYQGSKKVYQYGTNTGNHSVQIGVKN